MAAMGSDWLRQFRLLLGIKRNLTESKISTSSTKFKFFTGRSENQDGRHGLWMSGIFSTSFSATAERNSTKIDRKQELNVLEEARSQRHLLSFRVDRKTKIAALVSDRLRHFRLLFCSHWTEFNETSHELKSLHPLQSLCFASRSENQYGHRASDWPRHFRLLLGDRWKDTNKT